MTKDKIKSQRRAANYINEQLKYATSLLNTFMDQWEDLQQAAEEDSKAGEYWRLQLKFNSVSDRIENLLKLTDEILSDLNDKEQIVVDELRKDWNNEITADQRTL